MLELYILLALLALGFFVGQYLEKQHYRSINARESELVDLVTTSSKHPFGDIPVIIDRRLVQGSVVVSVDYFKRMLAALRNFFGGNVRAYETLVDRARREAVLRLKESCPDAKQIINLRIETSSIFKGAKDQIGSVEVLAYATALYY
ncbi:MAG: YbjQ family protein [Gammaproteobacteria bacterium]|nr:YbjQ family protein [Gammaproteobacteria bacterium]